ncbi:MAG: class E sortase [Acidimicrobiales bacterium]
MTFARGLGAVGRLMIRCGVLILLFVVYQLWGTGIHTTQAQSDLGRQFKAAQAELGATDPAPSTTADTAAPAGPTSTIAPPAPADGSLVAPDPGQPIGQITIPRIGADFYMVEGVDLKWLKEGPGHFPSTPLPGQAGNAAIAGHRTTYKAPFNRIDELEPGDQITITTLQGTFTYQVLPQAPSDPADPTSAPLGHRVVSPSQVEILSDKGDNRLTLMACNPKYSARQRIVVEAVLVGNPAPTTPRATGDAPAELPDNGLAGGDPTARGPAILWSLVALAIWFGAWYLSKRRLHGWWRVVPYVVLVPFFTVALYASFENITRLLPGAY